MVNTTQASKPCNLLMKLLLTGLFVAIGGLYALEGFTVEAGTFDPDLLARRIGREVALALPPTSILPGYNANITDIYWTSRIGPGAAMIGRVDPSIALSEPKFQYTIPEDPTTMDMVKLGKAFVSAVTCETEQPAVSWYTVDKAITLFSAEQMPAEFTFEYTANRDEYNLIAASYRLYDHKLKKKLYVHMSMQSTSACHKGYVALPSMFHRVASPARFACEVTPGVLTGLTYADTCYVYKLRISLE